MEFALNMSTPWGAAQGGALQPDWGNRGVPRGGDGNGGGRLVTHKACMKDNGKQVSHCWTGLELRSLVLADSSIQRDMNINVTVGASVHILRPLAKRTQKE